MAFHISVSLMLSVAASGFLMDGSSLEPAPIRYVPPLNEREWHDRPHMWPDLPKWPPIAPSVMTSWGRQSALCVRAEAQAMRMAALLSLPMSTAR